jgi:hypothetical protein
VGLSPKLVLPGRPGGALRGHRPGGGGGGGGAQDDVKMEGVVVKKEVFQDEGVKVKKEVVDEVDVEVKAVRPARAKRA